MNSSDQRTAGHSPRAWDDDDNEPVIPRFPRPRKPSAGAR